MSTGEVGILNVGAGDTKLTFDRDDPAECIRAGRIVRDMLRRGYALLVEVEIDGKKFFKRAVDFDESRSEYVIADFDQQEANDGQSVTAPELREDRKPSPAAEPKRRLGRKRVPADSTRAVSVARSAGG